MDDDRKAIADFESDYCPEVREILVLTNDKSAGSARFQGQVLWMAQQFFLACVDVATGKLNNGEGRIVWPLTEADEQDKALWMYRFKSACVYRLKVRELIDRTVPEGVRLRFITAF